MPFAVLLAALAEVPDPRRAQGQRYSMRHRLLSSVLAVLTGATSYQKTIAFIALPRERLNTVFGAGFRRAPAVNTLRHLVLALGRDDLEAAFRCHARDLIAHSRPEALRTVALDGKTLRGSVKPRGLPDFDHLTDRKAVHVLSAFASDAALILARQELAGAPDEVAAVPRLMAELGVTSVLFTAQTLRVSPPPMRCIAGRTASRRPQRPATPCWSASRTTSPPCTRRWPGCAPPGAPARQGVRHRRPSGRALAGAGRLRRPALAPGHHQGHPFRPVGHARGGRLLYPCQTRHGAKLLGGAIHAHWGIENRAHDVRDVTPGEDASRIRTKPGTMARIRSVALNVLRANGVQNISLALYANAASFDQLLALGAQ